MSRLRRVAVSFSLILVLLPLAASAAASEERAAIAKVIHDDLCEWDGKPGGWKDTRWTGVLEKRGGKWLIMQMHFSSAADKVAATVKARLEAAAARAQAGLAGPVPVLHGRQDPLGESVPLGLSSYYKESRRLFVEKCGHYSWIEQPEPVFAAIGKFLAEGDDGVIGPVRAPSAKESQ